MKVKMWSKRLTGPSLKRIIAILKEDFLNELFPHADE
jgi:hypothetical protein